jgi:hypothetical protein
LRVQRSKEETKMTKRHVILSLNAVLLLAGMLACGLGAPAPTPTPTPTEAPPTDTPIPTVTPLPTDTPVPEPTDTPVPTATPTEGVDMARFDEASGAFSLDYPAGLEEIEKVDDMGDLGYAFSGPGIGALMFMTFSVVADEPMSGFEWGMVVDEVGPELMGEFGEEFGSGGEFVELSRQEGESGQHTLYLEGESTDGDMRLAIHLDESDGVLAMVFWLMSADEWLALETSVLESLDSLDWSPNVVRDQAGGAGTGLIEDTITLEPTAEAREMLSFEDPSGVFTLDYPADFDDVWELGTGGYGYAFADADESHYIRVFFGFLDDTALSDADWEDAAAAVIPNVLEAINEDAVEVYREEGDPGVHWVYVEMESAAAGTYGMVYVEEAEGILAMVMAEVPADEWPAWEDTLLESLKGFSWWPQAAHEVLAAEAPSEPTPTPESVVPEPTATLVPRPTATPGTSTGFDFPPDKALFVFYNYSGVDWNVDFGPYLLELPAKPPNEEYTVATIIIDPGTYMYQGHSPGGGYYMKNSQGGRDFEFTVAAGETYETSVR